MHPVLTAPVEGEQMYSPRRVAELLDVDPRTLRRLVSSGQFPAADVAVGAKLKRWKRTTVEAWIESGGRNGTARYRIAASG